MKFRQVILRIAAACLIYLLFTAGVAALYLWADPSPRCECTKVEVNLRGSWI